MAKKTSVNNSPATGAEAIYELASWLVSDLGFTIEEASDGTTYPTTLTGGGAGAGGLGNPFAWLRLRDATGAGGREWTFQRDNANNTNWRVKMSALDGFVGGSPAATQTPSATDEAILLGGGTDASPSLSALFASDGTYRWHLSGFDAAETGVYPWYAFATINGTGVPKTLVMCDSLDPASYPALVGTRSSPTTGEPDPAVYVAAYDSSGSDPFQYGSSAGQWASTSPPGEHWYAMNGSNGETQAFVDCQAFAYYASPASAYIGAPADAGSGDGFGPNPLDGSDGLLPILYGRPSGLASSVSAKGFSAHLRWRCVDRDYPNTVDLSGERFVYAEHILIPFENGVTPLT